MPSAELCQNLQENNLSLSNCITGTRRQWRRGQLEFEAMMRQLDNAVSLPMSLAAIVIYLYMYIYSLICKKAAQ